MRATDVSPLLGQKRTSIYVSDSKIVLQAPYGKRGREVMEVGEAEEYGWLKYHEEEQLLICAYHGYALLALDSHLRDRHKDLSRKTRAAISDKYSGLQLRRPADDSFRHGPSNPRAPVDGLPMRDGWHCHACGLLTPSRKWLRVHYNDEHGMRGRVSQEPTVKIQTLFTGPKSAIHYFCVAAPREGDDWTERDGAAGPGRRSLPAARAEQGGLLDRIKEQWAHDRSQQEELQKVLADGAAKHETTNWLKRSGWTAHFVGRDLGQVYACSRMPGAEDDSVLQVLVAAVDRVFFERCVAGLTSMPLMTRLLLASPHPRDAHSRPFGPLQEKTSMDRYITYWKRFLCYCMRVLPLDEAALLKEHGFAFTEEQRTSLGRLWEHLQDEGRPAEELEGEVLRVSASFWMQRLDGDPFASPLWHFVAVLGIDGESGQLRPAHLFTYVLAGLVYVARALLAEYAIPAEDRPGMRELEARFASVRDAWLCKATYSPMGYVLSLLLYGRKIAKETGSRLMVSWSKAGDVMYFMGRPIVMDNIRGMMNEMIADAEDLLWGRLMFKEGKDARFSIPLGRIEDDLTHTQRGKSFLDGNGLTGKETEMLEDLVSGGRKSQFLDKDGQWKWEGIRQYEKDVRRFEELLAPLGLMTEGGPARGDEFGGLRRANGINRDRGVFVIDGEVVLVTQYHKSLAHFDSPKVVPRFLPPQVGQLYVMYLVYVKPLTDRWEAERWALYGRMKPQSDFLFHDENGPWEGSRISQAIAKCTYRYMGVRLTLQNWRHICIAISKKHARQRGAARADLGEEDDVDDDEAERYEVPDDLAAAHSTATANRYGVTMDILKRLTADSLEVFGQVSRRWHAFLGLDGLDGRAGESSPGRPASGKRKAATEHPALVPSRRPKMARLDKPGVGCEGDEPDQLLRRALRAVLRDDSAEFRTPQQEEAVKLAAAKESPLVAVLPTGGGKSLVFMVPAMMAGAGVTVVVAPYAELKRELVTRCVDAGLDCRHWPQAREATPRIVIVSGEAASGEDFLQWAAEIRTQGRLDRVVVDECHLTFTAALEYRKKLRGLVLLRNLGCPFVFLTGTLPPLCERDFEDAMHLQRPLYIRASSHRINTKYSVVRVGNGRGPMEVRRLVERELPLLAPGEKGIVYCRSHALCKALARLLKCHYYHSDPNDGDAHYLAQREEGFQAWVHGEERFIVATAALGSGLNVQGVTRIYHLGLPFSIIDYGQETGRGGRSGERVAATIVVEDRDWPSEGGGEDAFLELKEREVRSLVRTKGCRRRVLGQCLDNDTRDCKGIDAVSCDNCHRDDAAWKSELSSHGMVASAAFGRKAARGLERIQAALEEVEELGKMGCRICWMFEGAGAARHCWYECSRLEESLTFGPSMEFQRGVDYRKDSQAKFLSCFYCHVSQGLCPDGYKTKGSACRWKHIVIPAAYAACHDETLWVRVQELAGRQLRGEKDYLGWLGRKHGRLVCGQDMTNAMAVFNLILDWRVEQEAA